MLFRKHIVSMRALLQLSAALAIFAGGVGTALAQAANYIPPLLVPYTITTVAGETQYPSGTVATQAGFSGEGGNATDQPIYNSSGQVTGNYPGATMSSPFAAVVDSVGNVYITDTGNRVIREVNAQTGLITTIGGVVPKGCTGVVCSVRTSGCADGVLAAGAPIGSNIWGIAVDAYGNVYFDDAGTFSVSVIYRAGTRVANFIALEDPSGVALSGGSAQPGYVYHVAGTVNLTSCTGTVGNADNVLATSGQLHNSSRSAGIFLDSAGNIYIADVGNSTVRVVNTQATPQTFFQYTVQPGYIRSITNANASLTTPLPSGTTTDIANTGINGPVNAIVDNSQYTAASVDAYGNIYQSNGTGSSTGAPGIYVAAAYAGGAPLVNLLTAEAPIISQYFGPNPIANTPSTANAPAELPVTYGNSYAAVSNPGYAAPPHPGQTLTGSVPDALASGTGSSALDIAIRPNIMIPDIFGTFWFLDNHYPEFGRIDQYTSLWTQIIGATHGRATSVTGIASEAAPATFASPWFCIYGTSSSPPFSPAPMTNDPEGDGCPAITANYQATSAEPGPSPDGLGDIYLTDSENLIRELLLGNAFPATAVGKSVTQAIQVHFNSSDPPANITGGVTVHASLGYTTTSFSTTPGVSDFKIDTTDPEFPLGTFTQLGTANGVNDALGSTTSNFAQWAGLPTCYQFGLYPTPTTPAVTDYDCLVYVTFNPQAPGVRQSQLVVTTANGNVYNFSLSGVGQGPQLAIDGGTATPVATTGLGAASAVAVNSAGTVYVADPTNNRIVVEPAGGGTQKALAISGVTPATLSGPMGVALDSDGNVYVSDTGNNRILKVNPATGAATVLGNYVWVPGATCDGSTPASDCPGQSGSPISVSLASETGANVKGPTTAPPQYAFNAPEGLAVDAFNNVYVADTGNGVVVEIPSNYALGGAVPLLQYPNAPKFSKPVAVAVDAQNNLYVADANNFQVIELPPGGGDMVNLPGSLFTQTKVALGVSSPSGVAVDAAGDVYVSDSTSNTVYEIPSGTGPGSSSFALNFNGLVSPTGLALDPNGSLYVADSGGKQVLYNNRQNPMVNFGTVPEDLSTPPQPLCTNTTYNLTSNVGNETGTACQLTVSNIGNQPATLGSAITAITGTPNNAFTITNNNCASGPMPSGISCNLTVTFAPTSSGAQGENFSVNGTQSVAMVASGEAPLANVVLSVAYSSGTVAAAGLTATVTATVSQPHISGDTPSGSVTFTYAVDHGAPSAYSCGSGGTQTVNLSSTTPGTATASFNLPVLAAGLVYTINATYNSTDAQDTSAAAATSVQVTVPGSPAESPVASPSTFVYGTTPPAITGVLSPALVSPVTATFTSAATACTTGAGVYPVQVFFSGGSYCSYGFPQVLTSSGAAATVTETKAPLTYTIPNFTAVYGSSNLSYGVAGTFSGAVCGDQFAVSFTPPQSSILNVGTYTVTPTVIGPKASNYTITASTSTLTITQAPTTMSITAAKTQVANTAAGVASATYQITVSTAVPAGKGVPTGSVTVTDAFTPITPTGLGTPVAPVNTVLPLIAGFTEYLPSNTALGLHQYSFAYSGDSNFLPSTVAASSGCTPSAPTANCLVVDTPDFTLSSVTGPVTIVPGVTPSGNGLLAAPNQNASYPETAVLNVNAVLGFQGAVNLNCATQYAYVSCFMTPPSVCFAATTAGGCTTGTTAACVVAISTPTTLPLGYNTNTAQLQTVATRTVLAFLPFGVLAFCVRRRRRLSKALWMLMVVVGVSAGMSGCGGNQVDFYTPVPTGAQTVLVTASYAGNGTTQPAATRSFTVPINID